MNLNSFKPTPNFNLQSDPRLACTCGHNLCDKRVVNQLVVNSLQRVREDFHAPIKVTSGGRCSYHKETVRRVENGKDEGTHYACDAVDVWHDGTQAMVLKLVLLFGRHGATRIAVGANFVHADWSVVGSTRVPTWTYVDTLRLIK